MSEEEILKKLEALDYKVYKHRNYIEMPYADVCEQPFDEGKMLGELLIIYGWGFGVKGFFPPE